MYKVVKAFTDKHSYERFEVNSEYKPATEERAKELKSKGYIKEVKSNAKSSKQTKA